MLAIRDRVEAVLSRVRPQLSLDGGDVQVDEITDEGVVKLRFTGNFCGCPMSYLALHVGLEASLREAVPEIRRVETVTEASGRW